MPDAADFHRQRSSIEDVHQSRLLLRNILLYQGDFLESRFQVIEVRITSQTRNSSA